MMGFEKRECRAMVAAAIRVRSTTSTLPAKLIHNEALEGGKEGRKEGSKPVMLKPLLSELIPSVRPAGFVLVVVAAAMLSNCKGH